jgi:hypothetical protein
MPPQNARQIVRERCPNAVAQRYKAVHQLGQSAPIEPERWVIYAEPGLGQQVLGSGPTEAAAWTEASTRVLEGLQKPKGLRIKRDSLNDAGVVGGGPPLNEVIRATLDRGEPVIIEEADGSETPYEH